MVRIYSDIDDFFSKYGIEHFLKKYQFVDSDENQVCIINYGALNSGPFVIKITPNEISDAIQGYVTAFGKTLPVFEKPLETDDSGIIVACFENGSEKYPCVSFSDNEVTIGCDIFKNTGYLLSPNFDELVLNYDQKTKEQFRHYPLVDFYQDILFKSILYGYSKLNAPLVKKSPWPDGRKFAVALTHDVDELKKTYQWITRPVQYAYNRKFKLLINQFKSLLHKCMGEDPYWTFEKIIEIENNLDVKSTYFFLKESSQVKLFDPKTWHHFGRCRSLNDSSTIELIENIASEGHEIGLHGSFDSFDQIECLEFEKRELEQIFGDQIIGIRQHHLNLKIPETWEYQEKIGLLYDTSLCLKSHQGLGFRWGTTTPFYPHNGNSTLSILEIPLSIMEIAMSDETNSEKEYLKIIDEIEYYNGVLTILWHPPVFNDLEYPGFTEKYVDLIERCKKRGAWVTCAGDIYYWWKKRENSRFSYQYHDGELSIFAGENQGPDYIDIFLWDINKVENISDNVSLISKKDDSITLLWNDKTLPVKVSIRQSES